MDHGEGTRKLVTNTWRVFLGHVVAHMLQNYCSGMRILEQGEIDQLLTWEAIG